MFSSSIGTFLVDKDDFSLDLIHELRAIDYHRAYGINYNERENNFWIGTVKGLIIYEDSSMTAVDTLINNVIKYIMLLLLMRNFVNHEFH